MTNAVQLQPRLAGNVIKKIRRYYLVAMHAHSPVCAVVYALLLVSQYTQFGSHGQHNNQRDDAAFSINR